MGIRRLSIAVAIVTVLAAALMLAVRAPRPAAAQPGGCAFGGQSTDARTGGPIAGVQKTLLETGAVTHTDASGEWTFEVPGAGSYTVRSEHPDYMTATRRYVLDSDCRVVSDTAVSDGAVSTPAPSSRPRPTTTPRPAGTAQPIDTPLPSAIPAGNSRISGVLRLEGKLAPRGMRVSAFVGDELCGTGRVAGEGRYAVDVLPAAQRPGCAEANAPVQLKAAPSFGLPLEVNEVALFRADAAIELNGAWDPRQMAGRAENVPLIPISWADPSVVRIGICGEITASGEEAVRRAVEQWQDAYTTGGLAIQLVADGDAVCGETESGITVIEDVLDERSAIAGAGHVDQALRPCRRNAACAAFKSLVVINRPALARLDAEEQANVLAHEIGHALGLGHSLECTGATIMWADTRCRYPMTVVGPDDIASLNRKVAPAVALSQPRTAAVAGSLRGRDARAAMSLPPLITVLAEGSVTLARPAHLGQGVFLDR